MSYKAGQLITTAQDYTTSWADLGDEIDTHGIKNIALWIENDSNSGTGLQVQLLGKNTYSTTLEFNMPIKTVSSTSVLVEENVATFTDGSDTKFLIGFTLDMVVPKVQFQVKATGAGSTAQVDSASYTAW
jgi:hypothetical protein